MTKPALSATVRYLHALLQPGVAGVRLRVHRSYHVTVSPAWGRRGAFVLDDCHLLFVRGGRPIYWLDGEMVELARGDVVFASPGVRVRHGQDPREPPQFVSLRFGPEPTTAVRTATRTEPSAAACLRPHEPARFEGMFEQLHTMTQPRDRPLVSDAISGLLYATLWAFREACRQRLAAGDPSIDPKIEQARLTLERDPEANWSVAALAASLNLSVAQFTRRFKQQLGVTPKHYQLQARMPHARFLLEQEQASVQRVAARLGYSDPFVFSRQFRRCFGVPPSTMRNSPCPTAQASESASVTP